MIQSIAYILEEQTGESIASNYSAYSSDSGGGCGACLSDVCLPIRDKVGLLAPHQSLP